MTTDFDFQLHISGQCPSGKNAVIVTRGGHRFPNKRFVDWRQLAMDEVFPQLHKLDVKLPLQHPVNVSIEYIARDRIRRDKPGIEDALWHLLEKVNVVSDDTFLGGYKCESHFYNKGVDKKNAGVTIRIWGDYGNTEPLYKKQSRQRSGRQTRQDASNGTSGRRKKIVDESNLQSGVRPRQRGRRNTKG